MPTAQIPPNPAPSAPPARGVEGGELYDGQYWESMFVGPESEPALLIELQDQLSHSRRREAFWISVVVHLVVVLLLWNSDKFERLMPRRAVVVVRPEDSNKDLTYLELPPDQQKVTKRPDTNIISDKDRIATSKAPQLDREELKRILDASRPGRPGSSGAEAQQQAPASSAAQNVPNVQQAEASPPPAPPVSQAPRLQTPSGAGRNVFANSGALSPGSAIAQAAQATTANRGAYGGDSGDYGLGTGRKPTATMGNVEVLSDTMGIDFGPYLQRVLHDIKQNWYNLIPEEARAPILKRGKLSIEFAILKEGKIAGMKLDETSGDVALDRGAWGGITASNPFPPLPDEFRGQYLALRIIFFYNPGKDDLR